MAGTPHPKPASQPSQQHTHQCIRVCLFVVVSHIYIIYAPHHTDRQTDRHRSIDRSLSILSLSLSLSIHSLGSCCLHTLTPPPHDSRRARVCVCVHLAPFRAMLQTSR